MNMSLLISIWLLQGTVASYIASRKGRNPFLWFFLGCLFGLLGILVVFFMKPVNVKVVVPTAPPAGLPHRMWYYLDAQSQQYGPISSSALESAFRDGKIFSSTYVWHEEMENWEEFSKVCENHSVAIPVTT